MVTHHFYGPCMEVVNYPNVSVGQYHTIKSIKIFKINEKLIYIFNSLCAVFGGVYCLKRQLDGVVVDDEKCKAIITGKQRLALEHLVVGQGHLPPEIVSSAGEQKISRGIFITDR